MRSVYVPVALSPVNWTVPTPVAASPLLAELIGYRGEASGPLTAAQRAHGEALLADLLEPVPLATLDVPFPAGPLAGAVTSALREDPADSCQLINPDDTLGNEGPGARNL